MIESKIEKELDDLVTKSNGLSLKLTGYNGIPDRLVISPYGKVFFVELKKSKGGVISKSQEYFYTLLKNKNCDCRYISSIEEINQLLKEFYD